MSAKPSPGLQDYRTQEKDRWRWDVWTHLGGRIHGEDVGEMIGERWPKVENQTILYLPGPQDAERRYARELGFRPENIIGVDTDAEVVKRIRARRGLCIDEPLHLVLDVWPEDWPIHVVVADLTGRLDGQGKKVYWSILNSTAVVCGALFLINVIRGRERCQHIKLAYRASGDTHRGRFFYKALEHQAVEIYHNNLSIPLHLRASAYEPTREKVHEIMRPKFWSYKNRGCRVVMDSFLVRKPFYGGGWKTKPYLQRVRRKVIALRAVRTRFMRQWGRG